MKRLVSSVLAVTLLLVAAVPALAAQPPRPEPLTVDCGGFAITVEFRHRGHGGGGAVAFYEGRPLLALGGTFSFVVTDEADNVVLEESESFRMAKGIPEDQFLQCSYEETFTFTDPELAEGLLTATVVADLLILVPGPQSVP